MSRLTSVIGLLYRMADADAANLETVLLESMKDAWTAALSRQARRHNCDKRPSPPRLQDLAELRRMAAEDAASITATYNRDVTREIERLYAANVRGNRSYYFANLERWTAQRSAWKGPQIAVTTETRVREYATRRFEQMNYDDAIKYSFVGPPPTCIRCVRLKAAGIVTAAFIQRNPAPVHIACPHQWRVVSPPKLACEDIWVG